MVFSEIHEVKLTIGLLTTRPKVHSFSFVFLLTLLALLGGENPTVTVLWKPRNTSNSISGGRGQINMSGYMSPSPLGFKVYRDVMCIGLLTTPAPGRAIVPILLVYYRDLGGDGAHVGQATG